MKKRHLTNSEPVTWAGLALRGSEMAGVDARALLPLPACKLGHPTNRQRCSALHSQRAMLLPGLDDTLVRYVHLRRERASNSGLDTGCNGVVQPAPGAIANRLPAARAWRTSGSAAAPMAVQHAGPGTGAMPGQWRCFNSAHYRIVLFDQRWACRYMPLYAFSAVKADHAPPAGAPWRRAELLLHFTRPQAQRNPYH